MPVVPNQKVSYDWKQLPNDINQFDLWLFMTHRAKLYKMQLNASEIALNGEKKGLKWNYYGVNKTHNLQFDLLHHVGKAAETRVEIENITHKLSYQINLP